MSIQITALVVGIVLFTLIFEMLRRRALREKYAVVWLFTGLFIILSGFFPNLVVSLSDSLGFNVPSNFVFSLAGLVMLIVIMHMSLEIGTLEDKVQTLAEESALMRKRIDDNEKHLDS